MVQTASSTAVGDKLRKIRKKNKMTLKEVALEMGCSAPFISMVENGRSGISLSKLQRLLAIYGLSMADLIVDDSFSKRVVTLDEARKLGSDRGAEDAEAFLLTRNVHEKHLEPILSRLNPGATIGPFQHKGEEFGHVIKGSFNVTLVDPKTGDREYFRLNQGDTIYYNISMTHTWSNPTDSESIFIAAVTPPSF